MKRKTGLRTDEEGAVLVETALVLSALILFLIAVYDLGGMLVREMQITNALRAGTQYALVRKPMGGDVSQVRAAILQAAPEHTTAPEIAAEFYCACSDGTRVSCSDPCPDGNDRQSFITATYQEDYELLFRYPGFGQTITLEGETTVRLN